MTGFSTLTVRSRPGHAGRPTGGGRRGPDTLTLFRSSFGKDPSLTPQADRIPGSTAVHHLYFALIVAASGVLAMLAASVDPWLLVMMAGVAISTYAIYDRTDPAWYAL
jgi:hypothetical protein